MRNAIWISIVVVGAASSISPLYPGAADAAQGTKSKSLFPRAAILISPRWAKSPAYSTEEVVKIASRLGATDIVWHYLTRGPGLAVAARAEGLRVNCALPSNTRKAESACKNPKTGKPVVLHGWDGIYVADTNSTSFRKEVSDYLQESKHAGCTSLQQDNPWFMYYRREEGCYNNSSPTQVKTSVKSYYGWLHSAVTRAYGDDVPMTYNKKFYKRNESEGSLNELARFFDGVVAEVEANQNTPGKLYDTIFKFNTRKLGLTTATTLKSASVRANQRHIAAVYALGGHPIFPWDVYMEKGKRIYGDIGDYLGYYKVVKDHPDFFNGMNVADAVINHSSGKVASQLGLKLVGNPSNTLAVLKEKGGARVLHLVNWGAGRRTLKVQLPKSQSGDARYITIIKPDAAPSTLPLRQASPQVVEFEVPDLDVWALIAFSENAAE